MLRPAPGRHERDDGPDHGHERRVDRAAHRHQGAPLRRAGRRLGRDRRARRPRPRSRTPASTPSDVDFIIFATMTPDHYFPGNGGLLARRLGMKTTHALDIRMQCAGFLSGLQTADAFIRSGMYDRVLLVGRRGAQRPHAVARATSGTSCSGSPRGPATRAGTSARPACATAPSSSATAPARWSSRRTRRATAAASSGSRCTRTASTGTSSTCPAAAASRGPYFTPEMFETLGTIPIVEGRQVFRLATQLMPAAVLDVLAAHGKTLDDARPPPHAPGEPAHQRGGAEGPRACPTRRSSTTSRSTATRPPRRSRSRSTRRSSRAA